jgi:hypothetical protein
VIVNPERRLEDMDRWLLTQDAAAVDEVDLLAMRNAKKGRRTGAYQICTKTNWKRRPNSRQGAAFFQWASPDLNREPTD